MLPNISFAFPVFYLVPPLETSATNVTAFGLNPPSPEEPKPTQAVVETAPAREISITRPVTMTNKVAKKGKKVVTPTMQRESSICAICDFTGHPTHICLELDELKPLLGCEAGTLTRRTHKKEIATKSTVKPLRTNHTRALCETYGNYTHHCPEILRYKDALHAVEKSYQEDPSIQSINDEPHVILYMQEERESLKIQPLVSPPPMPPYTN